MEVNLILGASTSTSLDKHLKRKLSDRYLDFTNTVKGATEKLQTAILNIQVYLAKRGDYPLKLTKNHELSGNASACPTKMGEGENGPSYFPLPKVVERSEEVPQLNLNQDYSLQEYPAMENYHNINSFGFPKKTHLVRNLIKESDNWEHDAEVQGIANVDPRLEEEEIPEDYEEDHYEETDPTLLAKYILFGPDHTERLDFEDGSEDSISSYSSSSSPSSLVESRMGDESWVAWWEGWMASFNSLETLSSPLPQSSSNPNPSHQVSILDAWWEGWKSSPTPSSSPNPSHQVSILDAWWEGWKSSPTPSSNPNPSHQVSILDAWWEGWKSSPTPSSNPNPSHQVSILDTWWEGWKESETPVQLSLSSLILLFYLLILYYIFSDLLLCTTEPVMYDLSNHCVTSLRHSALTGSMGGWVKVPDHYSSFPKPPPWQSPLDLSGSWPLQGSSIAQVIQRIIFMNIMQPKSTAYLTQVNSTNFNPGSRVLSMAFQDPVRIFDPG